MQNKLKPPEFLDELQIRQFHAISYFYTLPEGKQSLADFKINFSILKMFEPDNLSIKTSLTKK